MVQPNHKMVPSTEGDSRERRRGQCVTIVLWGNSELAPVSYVAGPADSGAADPKELEVAVGVAVFPDHEVVPAVEVDRRVLHVVIGTDAGAITDHVRSRR